MNTDIPSAAELQTMLQPLRTGDLTRISKASGVPFGTLWKVRSGETTNPGIETVRRFLPHIPGQSTSQAGEP
jgi:predicted transcriptional regulator